MFSHCKSGASPPSQAPITKTRSENVHEFYQEQLGIAANLWEVNHKHTHAIPLSLPPETQLAMVLEAVATVLRAPRKKYKLPFLQQRRVENIVKWLNAKGFFELGVLHQPL